MDQGHQVAQDPRIGVAWGRFAEVEDVARSSVDVVEDRPSTPSHMRPTGEHQRGVEVALDGLARTQPTHRAVERLT
jgi:hypothetical protein